MRRDAAEALRVVNITSRNTAEKHTASSPICNITAGESHDRPEEGGTDQREAINGDQQSGDRAT